MNTKPQKSPIKKRKYPDSFEGMSVAEFTERLRAVLAKYNLSLAEDDVSESSSNNSVTVGFIK